MNSYVLKLLLGHNSSKILLSRGHHGRKFRAEPRKKSCSQGIVYLLREEKQHKHKLFGPDFPRTFLTLTPGCPGVKKFLPTTGAAGKRTFWCGRPRCSARPSMTRRVVKKRCTKKVCVHFSAPTYDLRFGALSQRAVLAEGSMHICLFTPQLVCSCLGPGSGELYGGQCMWSTGATEEGKAT